MTSAREWIDERMIGRSMNRSIGWSTDWMNQWIDWLNDSTNQWMDRWIDGSTDPYLFMNPSESTNQWMFYWIDESMMKTWSSKWIGRYGWANGQVHACMHVSVHACNNHWWWVNTKMLSSYTAYPTSTFECPDEVQAGFTRFAPWRWFLALINIWRYTIATNVTCYNYNILL